MAIQLYYVSRINAFWDVFINMINYQYDNDQYEHHQCKRRMVGIRRRTEILGKKSIPN